MYRFSLFDLKWYLNRMSIKGLMGLVAMTFICLGCSHVRPYYKGSELPRLNGSCEGNERDIIHRLILIGDAGEPFIKDPQLGREIVSDRELRELCPDVDGALPTSCKTDPTLVALYKQAKKMHGKTTIVFLGDNIYPAGLPDGERDEKKYKEARLKLDAQIRVLRALEKGGGEVEGIFIPGNHDWAHWGEEGNDAVKRMADYITSNSSSKVYPKPGCPGPEIKDYDGIRLIFVDTQWWLHEYSKEVASCPPFRDDENALKDAFIEGLKNQIKTAGGREVILLAHHPIDTRGTHGGFFDWRDYLFPGTRLKGWLWVPLPLMVPPIRWYVVRNNQDLVGPRYRELVERLKSALSAGGDKKPFIYASGHDHSLQVLKGDDAVDFILVSGAGSSGKVGESTVTDGENTLFAHLHPGFMQLDFMRGGGVLLCVIEPVEGVETVGLDYVFSHWLR